MRLLSNFMFGLWITLHCAQAQVIEFESNGLKYQTLTRNSVTVMFATLPSNIKGYTILQVAVSNGSKFIYPVDPEDFVLRREDGSTERALPARQVVKSMLDHANRDDVIRLVSTYEIGLYGLQRMQSNNGYEQRRQTANGEFGSSRLKAAAATSAIALVKTKIAGGESTDGAVFFAIDKKTLRSARLTLKLAGELFEFETIGHFQN